MFFGFVNAVSCVNVCNNTKTTQAPRFRYFKIAYFILDISNFIPDLLIMAIICLKSGFPIVRRAAGDAARKSVLVLFPLPALWKSAKITEKSVRVYAKTNTLTFTNTLKSCIMNVQTEYGWQVKYHCLPSTFVKRLYLAEAVLT